MKKNSFRAYESPSIEDLSLYEEALLCVSEKDGEAPGLSANSDLDIFA